MHDRRLGTRIFFVASMLVLLAATPASATILQENSLASWQAAVNNLYTNLTFETLTATSYPNPITLPTSMDSVTFIGFRGLDHTTNFYLQVLNENQAGGWYDWGGGGKLLRGYERDISGDVSGIRVDFASGSVYAVFLDIMIGGLGTGQGQATIEVAPGNFTNITTAAKPTRTQIGFLSDTPISYVDVVNMTATLDSYAIIDNVYFSTTQPNLGGGGGPGAETVEPATLLFIGTGLVFLRLLRRLYPHPA